MNQITTRYITENGACYEQYVITDPEKVRKFVCVDTNDAPEVAVVDPADRHHLFCITGVDCDLSGIGIQNCVAAEEWMTHLLFHMHTDLIKFMSH